MKKLITSVLALTCLVANAQIDRSIRPKAAEAPQINIAAPATFKLDNGIQVIVSENHKQPKVSLNLVMGSDPYYSDSKAGLTDMVSELMMSGTTNRPKDQLDNEKDFIGAYLNASSSNIYLSCLTKHLDKGMDLMTDILHNASFPESEFVRIKKQFESGLLSAQSDPSSMANNAEVKTLFPNHPYAMVMTEKSLNSITRDDVIAFYKERFTPSGAYLVIVGDITTDKAREIAEKNFGDWDGAPSVEANFSKGKFNMGNRVIFVEKPGAVQSVITIAQPIKMNPGEEDQIKLSVMNKILGGGGFGTRLMQNLREDKAYTYGAYTSLDIDRYGSYISASGNFRNEVTDSAIVQFLYEFNRITEEEVTTEELELNKAAMAGGFARSLESPQTIARFALNTYRNKLDSDYYQNYLKKLSAVSKEDVLAAAKTYINPNGLNIIVVGSPDVLESLKQFDADGNIEKLDAFGNPAVKVEYKEANLAKEVILEKHILALTGAKNMKKANKIFSKIKSVEQNIIAKPAQAPIEVQFTSIYKEGKTMSKAEFNGMVLSKSVFDGEKGSSKQMSQTGFETTEMTAEEIALAQRFSDIAPEYSLLNKNLEYELLGTQEIDGKIVYVLKYDGTDGPVTSYYDAETFMKTKSVTLTTTEEESFETVATFSNYKMVGKLIFPHTIKQVMGPQSFDQEVQEIIINGKVDDKVFAL
ncbi:MAG: M16 family metallopeptidase [Lishizhenia sp.]